MFKDISNQIFGRLTAISPVKKRRNNGLSAIYWLCQCNCEDETFIEIDGSKLRSGNTKSCGCLQKETASDAKKKHGDAGIPLHNIWKSMRTRCIKPNHPTYKSHGARGIKVCDEWLDLDYGYIRFKEWALKNGYKEGLTIERIDNDGNYEPSNCRWATQKEQMRNTRKTVYCEYKDQIMPLIEIVEKYSALSYPTVRSRIKRGWSVEDALFTPVRQYI